VRKNGRSNRKTKKKEGEEKAKRTNVLEENISDLGVGKPRRETFCNRFSKDSIEVEDNLHVTEELSDLCLCQDRLVGCRGFFEGIDKHLLFRIVSTLGQIPSIKSQH